MASIGQKQQPELTTSATHFPLSSPISEEITSPLSSASDDESERNLERNRPFEFLSRATNRNILRKGSGKAKSRADDTAGPNVLGLRKAMTTMTDLGSSRRQQPEKPPFSKPNLDLNKITRQYTEPPIGLNLVTNFSPSAPSKRVGVTAAPFVDLNDLKLLSKERERERSVQKVKEIFRKRTRQGFHKLPESPEPIKTESLPPRPGLEKEGVLSEIEALSPSDRPIIIGMALSTGKSLGHEREDGSREPGVADTGNAIMQTPATPSITITPAKEAPWSELHSVDSLPLPRAASSVYSQPTPRLERHDSKSDIPPVPSVPDFFFGSRDENTQDSGSYDILSVSTAMERKQRAFSGVTLFEEDYPPIDSKAEKNPRNLTVNTDLNRHQSQGWWTYLLSPLLGNSNKTPSQKSSPIHAPLTASSEKSSKCWWDQETFTFAPNPSEAETAATSISGIPRFQAEKRGNNPFLDAERLVDSENEDIFNEKQPQPEFTMMPFASPGQEIQGEAAEYYQACAHELFSGTPYFECINHVCSITPISKLPIAESDVLVECSEERGLAEADKVDTPRSADQGPQNPFEDKALPLCASCRPGITSIANSSYDEALTSSVKGDPIIGSPPRKNSLLASGADIGATTGTRAVSEPLDSTPINPPEEKAYNPLPERPSGTAMPAPISNYNPQHLSAESLPQYTAARMQDPMPPVIFIPPLQPQWQPPNPTSPGLQEATEKTGSIPLSDMRSSSSKALDMGPAPAPERPPSQTKAVIANDKCFVNTPPPWPAPVPMAVGDISYPPPAAPMQRDRSLANVPPRLAPVPVTVSDISPPTSKAKKLEKRRRRLEREDAVGKKIGGLWRGLGPFSSKGCFGRPGREGRIRRRWYFVIALFFLLVIALAIILAITLTRKGDQTPVKSQWLNLTGYPPMPIGITTIAGAEPQVENSGCISPSSLWSCSLPKEQQAANEPYAADQPNLRVEIRFQNGTFNYSTQLASPRSSMVQRKARDTSDLFNPSPSPPSLQDQEFIGNTTDGNSEPYAGEETPFYITILSTVQTSSTPQRLVRRSDTGGFPNLTALIPSPDVNPDGTAAPANLYPLSVSQPVRLYNRGQPNEHYGFYTYFDRSIFLESSSPINNSNTDNLEDDRNGGSSIEDARVRCTWAQTRFLVQMWTQPGRSGMALMSGSNNSSPTATKAVATSTATSTARSSSANNFTRPGSFPYPVTITLDRHGGMAKKKLVYCYGVDSDQHINSTEKKIQIENRGFGGYLINQAPGIFNLSTTATADTFWGGVDGGTGGCKCQWTNWVSTS
ncbi:hypothetical protein MPDQ_000925 [Monascus purpureus]|uniref:Glycoprotease family protein n=1 Tax=Monascus purpureus TaxID=5098 RepID=A0A507QT04_MONPU|nr:hypothetical protein MPDQ_000925 [Monascus purpureus]